MLAFEAAAFFLVEEEDGVGGEVFALGGGDGGGGVLLAESGGGGAGSFGLCEISASRRPLARTRKPKLLRRRMSRLPAQVFGRLAGRVGEPVSGEGEVLAEGGKRGVAGVVVAVEADVGLVAGSCAWAECWLLRVA